MATTKPLNKILSDNIQRVIDITTKCTTVDEIVEKCIQHPNYIVESDYDSCEFIVTYYPASLNRILKLETNIPSKWDLILIDCITKLESLNGEHIDILKFYNNRK